MRTHKEGPTKLSKKPKDIPIDHIRRCLDGAARDNTFYQWLLEACDIIEALRKDQSREFYGGYAQAQTDRIASHRQRVEAEEEHIRKQGGNPVKDSK